MRILGTLLLAALASWGQTKLAATEATARRVRLAYSGSGTVERKLLGARDFTPLGPVAAGAYEDSTIAALDTYVYRVKGATASNEVIVGPPPVGYSLIARAPKATIDQGQARYFGYGISAAPDANGDPAVLYLERREEQADLWFATWSRKDYRWNQPVKLGAAGEQPLYRVSLVLARDAASGTWLAATEDGSAKALVLRSSTDGNTWSEKLRIPSQNDNAPVAPGLAVRDGIVHLSYTMAHAGPSYLTGSLSTPASSWKTTRLPGTPRSGGVDGATTTTLALDAAGLPAITFWERGKGDYERILAFWRPGMRTASAIIDTRDQQSDNVEQRFAFTASGEPRVLASVRRAPFSGETYYRTLWTTRSRDGGKSWTEPAYVPSDGQNSLDPPLGWHIDASGRGIVAFSVQGGGGAVKCAGPSLARSADGDTWTTCATPAAPRGASKSFTGADLLPVGNGGVYYVWNQWEASPLGIGIALWREK